MSAVPMMMNFVNQSRDDKDVDLFLGPIDEKDEFIRFDSDETMANLLVRWGQVSKSESSQKEWLG